MSRPAFLFRFFRVAAATILSIAPGFVVGQEVPPTPKPPATAEEPSEAAPKLSGFDLIEAYQGKVSRLKQFQSDRALQTSDLQQRTSQASAELMRLIGGLEELMRKEAESLYRQAMSTDDPEIRDGLLKRLAKSNFSQLQDIRSRAEDQLEKRTVAGKVYYTIEEAKAALKKQKAAQELRWQDRDAKDLEALKELKSELLTDELSKAAKDYAEVAAERRYQTVIRLVMPQRKIALRKLIDLYPNTNAAQKATYALQANRQYDEAIANRKLSEAMMSSTIYDQRWRRLKELLRDHPDSPAAIRAEQMLSNHAATVPSMSLLNMTAQPVKLTLDRAYQPMISTNLTPGNSSSFHSVFPIMVRVKVGDSEWDMFHAYPGYHYSIPTHSHSGN